VLVHGLAATTAEVGKSASVDIAAFVLLVEIVATGIAGDKGVVERPFASVAMSVIGVVGRLLFRLSLFGMRLFTSKLL